MTSNPIIPIENFNIQTIGDPHLGRTFKTGVPSSKLGVREEAIFKMFETLMNPEDSLGITHVVIMGDLFDKFIVSPKVTLRTFNIILESVLDNPSIKYYLLPGNHDFSRDKTKVSSYELLEALLKDSPSNLKVICDNTCILETITPSLYFYFDCYNPFHADSEDPITYLEHLPKEVSLLSFGHWDDVTNDFGHYFPSEEILERSDKIISGHIHQPKAFDKYIYTGSMQPYSHAEDLNGSFYQTISYDLLEAIIESSNKEEINKLSDKNIRISCYPGYVFPHKIECLSLTYFNNLTEETLLEISKPLNTISDFSTLYLHTLKEDHNLSLELLTKINSFLKDTSDNVYFTLD